MKMIKFQHSLFALPFAFTAALLSADGIPSMRQIIWIAAAMVGARSAAMGMNRIIDRRLDALNPRTKNREIPSGKIRVRDAELFTIVSLILFLLAAYMLNPLCFKLSPVAIAILFIYSYTKRFTWFSHLVLGIAISLAPLGAWIAIRGNVEIIILPLIFAVIFWLAGFDILYALKDIEFDRKYGLYSIPQRFGISNSIIISRGFHFTTWIFLVFTGVLFKLGIFYYAGVFIAGGLLIYEHSLVKENDLSKLDIAFFNMNGYISITIFLFTLIDVLIRN